MSYKDDPLQQKTGGPYAKRALWLDRENAGEARENYWDAFKEYVEVDLDDADKRTWTISWAAAIAAFTYMMEGRVEPKGR